MATDLTKTPNLEPHIEIPHEETEFGISYGKIMMWYFLISDTFTFAAFLVAYAMQRFRQADIWPSSNEVFQSVPGITDSGAPLIFVSIMTFILILSSVTMVRAVQEGFMKNRKGVIMWLIPTILGGMAFLYCQYLEWTHLMHQGMSMSFNPFSGMEGVEGPVNFGQFFFTITGFHGMHVFVGVCINIWLLIGVINGTYDRRGSYEMVEKVGLFWHFVDLVWVYVFLAYYLL